MYLHCSNLSSPIDKVDQAFLNILADYRIGPPIATPVRGVEDMIKDGVFGVYTTKEAMANPQVMKLTGFTLKSLGTETL